MKVLAILTVITLTLISRGAQAGCSPAEIAHLGAMLHQEDRLTARAQAGECSLIPEINRLLVITRGIIRQDMVTRGCYGFFKKLKSLVRCGCTDADHIYACNGNAEAGSASGAPKNRPAQPDQNNSTAVAANGPGASKALPVPPTVPAPTAGQSRQQVAMARRSEESSVFQSGNSSSGCTDDVGPGMLLVDPGTSLIGSGDCPGRGHANAPGGRRNGRSTGSPGNPDLSALQLLEKRYPNQASPITAQELRCLLSPPQVGRDQPLKPLQICWSPDQIRKEGMEYAGLCQNISDDAELEDCIQQNFGTAVLAVLPELSLSCYGGPDYGTDSECVKRKFLKAWDDFHNNEFDIRKGLEFDDSSRHPTSRGPCAIVPPPDPATWTTPEAAACAAKKPSIRQKIRDALQRCRLDPACSGSNGDNEDAEIASNAPPPQQDAAPPQPPPLPKENEAWCNYMADAHRRGDLLDVPIPDACPREKTAYDKPPDEPLFAMSPVDTDQRIKDLEDEWCNDADNHCPWRKPLAPQPMERK